MVQLHYGALTKQGPQILKSSPSAGLLFSRQPSLIDPSVQVSATSAQCFQMERADRWVYILPSRNEVINDSVVETVASRNRAFRTWSFDAVPRNFWSSCSCAGRTGEQFAVSAA